MFLFRIERLLPLCISFPASHHRSDSLRAIFAFTRTSYSERTSDRHALRCVTASLKFNHYTHNYCNFRMCQAASGEPHQRDGVLCSQSTCNVCNIIRVQPVLLSDSFPVLTHSSCRAPSSSPSWEKPQTSAGLEQVSIRLLHRPRLVRFICNIVVNIKTVVCSTG